MEQLDEFHKFEDEFQRQFDEKIIEYVPIKILIVTILRGRVPNSAKYKDKLKISVTCPQLYEFNQFTTKVHVNCEANETFKFVLDDDVDLTEEFPCLVKLLYMDSSCSDDASVDISKLCDYVTSHVTLCLELDCEVDLEIKIRTMDVPDFRLSAGLHPGEKDYRKRRIPIVHDNLKKFLEPEKAPTSLQETPIISLSSSGGGYRAMVGTMGTIDALEDSGIFDCLSYIVGLSGSAWYLTTAYGTKSMSDLDSLHSSLRIKMKESAYMKFLDPWHFASYWKYIKTKRKFSQPASLVDLCGYTLGTILLGKENLGSKLSDMREYVEDASLPLPLFISLHVKNTVLSSSFHAYMECSPFEISFPSFGIGMRPEDVGSIWNAGALVRKCPEFPLHLHQGITGAALALLFAATPGFGEVEEDFIDFMDRLRLDRKASVVDFENADQVDLASDASGDTDDEEDDVIHDDNDDDIAAQEDDRIFTFNEEEEKTKTPEEIRFENDEIITHLRTPKIKSPDKPSSYFGGGIITKAVGYVRERIMGTNNNPDSLAGRVRSSFAFNLLKNTAMKGDRDSYVGRTGKLFNFTYNLRKLPNFALNPHGVPEIKCDTSGCSKSKRKLVRKMSVNKKVISLVDAACHNNVAADIPLRTQRGTNVLIVTDFSDWISDEVFQPVTLLSAATNAWKEGLKFPFFNFKSILRLPPTECIVLEDENDDECPIVIWFTLCNKKFKEVENFVPRCEDFKTNKDFNKFNVFGENSPYTTTNLCYDELQFERLRELMYFNVMSNIEVIKSAIARATERKRRVLARQATKE